MFLQYGGLMVIYYGKNLSVFNRFFRIPERLSQKTHPNTTTLDLPAPAMPLLHGSSIVVPGMEHGRHRG